MFWKLIYSDPYAPCARKWLGRDLEADPAAASQEDLASPDVRAYLAERFRLVFEFATLGAYEEATSGSPHSSEERKHSQEHRQPVDGHASAHPGPRACAAPRP